MKWNPWAKREWNPILGCDPCSDECRHCYAAERLHKAAPRHEAVRIAKDGRAVFTGVTRTGKLSMRPDLWNAPKTLDKPDVIFAFSQCDLFGPSIGSKLHERAFDVIRATPHHQYNLLTKRPEAMQAFVTQDAEQHGGPVPNLCPGISAGQQSSLDALWPFLRDTPAAMRHLSIQPFVGPIELPDDVTADTVTWVVIMAEVVAARLRGKLEPRPMRAEWVRSLRSQCDERGIPFYWEVTTFDLPECGAERQRAMREGKPYRLSPGHLRAWG